MNTAAVRRLALVALALWSSLVVLAGAPSKIVGDGGEYFVTAVAMAQGGFPPFTPDELAKAKAVLVARDPRFDSWDLNAATWPARSGDRDFVHFWGYALLAAPGVWIALRAGVDAAWAFVILNVCLLSLATAATVRRFGITAALCVCVSPILWWADKVHGEAFTVSLLTLAVCLLPAGAHWAAVAIGVAALQNPPLALLLVPCAFVGWRTGARESRGRLALGLGAGLGIALLHPAYYAVSFGRFSLLTSGARGVVPAVQELGAVLWDTNLGLIPGDPVFVVAVAVAFVALLRRRRGAWRDDALVSGVACAAVILVAAAQTPNIHHGGTPGLSRYALWLIPLAAPLLAAHGYPRPTRRVVGTLAVLSAASCLWAYRPSVPEKAYRPSWLSATLWTRLPALNNPLPEVFAETISHVDGKVALPAALQGCEKALLLGSVRRGIWPIPCYPSTTVPPECASAGSLCYANRQEQDYRYAKVRRSPGLYFEPDPGGAWSPEVEPLIRRLYDDAQWWTLRPGDAFESARAVRLVAGVGQFWHFQSDRAVVLVARGIGDRAVVSVRLPKPMAGVLVDGVTGATIRELRVLTGPEERVDIALPPGHDVLLVVLR